MVEDGVNGEKSSESSSSGEEVQRSTRRERVKVETQALKRKNGEFRSTCRLVAKSEQKKTKSVGAAVEGVGDRVQRCRKVDCRREPFRKKKRKRMKSEGKKLELVRCEDNRESEWKLGQKEVRAWQLECGE